MLSSISWGDFLSVIIILLIIYYAATGILYYRKDIPQIIGRLTSGRRKNGENETAQQNEENS